MRRGRTADAVDQNVEPAEPVEGCLDDVIRAHARAAVRLDELSEIAAHGDGSGSGEYRSSAASQAIHDGLANALAAASDEDSLAGEFVCLGGDCGSFHGEPVYKERSGSRASSSAAARIACAKRDPLTSWPCR